MTLHLNVLQKEMKTNKNYPNIRTIQLSNLKEGAIPLTKI